MEFASKNLTMGQINAIVKKLGGEEEVLRILRSDFVSITLSERQKQWRDEDGVIYFSVTSDGTSGVYWITRLESKGCRVSTYAERVLLSSDFKPTSGVTYEVAVLRGCLFEDQNRITKKIRAEGALRRLSKPTLELACLIREKFTDKEIEEMGLWYITAMHEPVSDSDDGPLLLGACRNLGGRRLCVCIGGPRGRWNRDGGFAFIVSETKT